MFFQAGGFCEIFKLAAPFAVADEEEFDFGILTDKSGRDGEQIVVPFELEQPRDFADDKIVRRKAEFFAEFQIIFRGEKRFEREAAEDFGALLRRADAGGEILLRHRIGDDDEMIGDAGGVAFGGA